MKKIKAFYKDRSAKPIELDGVTFYVKPLSSSQFLRFQINSASGSLDFQTSVIKRSFANDHVEGWEGLLYDDGKEVEFSKENAIELLCDEDYAELFSVLFDKSYVLRQEMILGAEKDSKDVKK